MARAPWTQTASGRRFNLLDLAGNSYEVTDAIHAISKQCRFGGACLCEGIYSVAQHSVLVSELLERWYPTRYQLQYDGLMHDITEGYLPDMTSPLKALFPEYCALENQLAAILSPLPGFQFQFPLDSEVHHADLVLCATEKEQIMAPGELWHLPYPADPSICIEELSPKQAKSMFLARYYELRQLIQAQV